MTKDYLMEPDKRKVTTNRLLDEHSFVFVLFTDLENKVDKIHYDCVKIEWIPNIHIIKHKKSKAVPKFYSWDKRNQSIPK